eukprot:COSAG06_NODE_2261_length_7212_cov_80.772951_8_plen_111_part_00
MSALIFYVFSFGVGVGPLPFVIVSECLPQEIRGKTIGAGGGGGHPAYIDIRSYIQVNEADHFYQDRLGTNATRGENSLQKQGAFSQAVGRRWRRRSTGSSRSLSPGPSAR